MLQQNRYFEALSMFTIEEVTHEYNDSESKDPFYNLIEEADFTKLKVLRIKLKK